jgi:hypothetical protein
MMAASRERMNELRREPDYRALVRLLKQQAEEQLDRFSERYEREEHNESETDEQ